MLHRSSRWTRVGVVAAAAVVLLLVESAAPTPAANPPSGDGPLAGLLARLSRDTSWHPVSSTRLQFDTFHPQGMVEVGGNVFMSAVQVLEQPVPCNPACGGFDRTPGRGIGHLFQFDPSGRLLRDVHLGVDTVYHPGGLDYDGRSLWVPVSEYRPHSRAIIYRIDPATLTPAEVFRFGDHIGGITRDQVTGQLVGNNWGSRTFYTWTAEGRLLRQEANPQQFVDYQDCHYVPARKMVCAGIASLPQPGSSSAFQLGGLALLDLSTQRLVDAVPLTTLSPAGNVLTRNPFWVEAGGGKVRLSVVPDDDTSSVLVYDSDPL
jgi:hypothetical protein